MSKDVAKSASLFERACNAGDAHGCALLGHMYEAGEGVGRNPVTAMRLFSQGCSAGDS